MPKLFGREIPPVVLGGVGLVAAYVVYGALFPSDDTAPTIRGPKPPVKKSSGASDYLPTDYTFKIAPLADTTPTKDAFRPLVVKSSVGDKNGIQSIDNYTYSGMAQLNGVSNGLLENSQTGQGDFVQPGQHWHDQWLVIKITPEEMDLRSDATEATTVLLAGAAAAKSAASAGPTTVAAGGSSNPVMVGPIGASDISVQADATAQQPQQNNNRRRGRGRGGRGGGGGGATDGG
jgi:hypothetical protein